MTVNSAAYIYTGIEWNHKISDKLKFTPSFAPGLYHQGETEKI